MLPKKDGSEKTKKNIDRARKKINTNGFNFSYGIDGYKTSDKMDEFLNKIDFIMYENKKHD